MTDQEPTPEQQAEMREMFFGVLDNEDMDVDRHPGNRLSVTLKNKAVEIYGPRDSSNFDREATDIWIACFRESIAVNNSEALANSITERIGGIA